MNNADQLLFSELERIELKRIQWNLKQKINAIWSSWCFKTNLFKFKIKKELNKSWISRET